MTSAAEQNPRAVLIIGGSGKVGAAAGRLFREAGWKVIMPGRPIIDLTNPMLGPVLTEWMESLQPDLVVNAAAMTGAEACETAPELVWRINVDAAGEIARACAMAKAPLVHYSTDMVYPDPQDAYESITLNPGFIQGVYAQSKLLSEHAVRFFGGDALILRITTVYDDTYRGVLQPLAQAAQGLGRSAESPIKIFHQFCQPTSASLVAQATLAAVEGCLEDPRKYDVYNVASAIAIQRCMFIDHMLWRIYGPDQPKHLEPFIPDVPRASAIRLDTTRFHTAFGHKLPFQMGGKLSDWQADSMKAVPARDLAPA